MRYIPHTVAEVQEMLKTIGLKSLAELFNTIPEKLFLEKLLNLPPPMAEPNLMKHLGALANENQLAPLNRSFLGGGVYRHYIPAAVKDLVRRSEFVTPYTPYQPEIAQGTLQVMFEFQTMVCELFGMEVANASLYDGSTALAEACLQAHRVTKNRKNILIPACLHPEYAQVVRTLLKNLAVQTIEIPTSPEGTIEAGALNDYLNQDLAALVLPYPNFFGIVADYQNLVEKVHQAGGLAIVCVTEPLSLGLFKAPGQFGADIVCGEGQSLGLPPSFGGPFVGLFATKQALVRQMPGRLCGLTTDAQGRRGFVLTLSTREQHIRREKATSNICTNQALCATQVTIYLSLLGKEGLQKLAKLNWQRTEYAKVKLTDRRGVELLFPKAITFNEFVLKLPRSAEGVVKDLKAKGLDAGIPLGRWYPHLDDALLVNITEMNEKEEIDLLAKELSEVLK